MVGRIPILMIFVISIVGCASLKSTMLTRDESNSTWEKLKSDGYPITVKVPTHFRLTLYEKFYIAVNDKVLDLEATRFTNNSNHDATQNEEWKTSLDKLESRSIYVPVKDKSGKMLTALDFTTQLIETEKIFTVDHRRPAAGTLKFKTALTADQSIQKIESHAADDTIRQVGLAVQRLIANINGGTVPDTQLSSVANVNDLTGLDPKAVRPPRNPVSLTDGDDVGDGIQTKWRVIATRIFDLDDADVELQVATFLQTTVNDRCHH